MKKKLLLILMLMESVGGLALNLRGATATIDFDETYQTIDGFGACIVYGGTTGVYLNDDFLDFAAHDLGLSMFRMEIRPDLFAAPVENAADIKWENFDLQSRVTDGFSVRLSLGYAQGLMARRPDVRVIGTVWTPPAWMKDNNSNTGTRSGFLLDGVDSDNRLSDDKYDHFAKYLVEYVDLFRARGVPVYAISPGNEIMFTQTFQSCMYTPEEYARIVRRIGETFAEEGLEKPLIYGPEEMTQAHYGTSRHKPYVDALMAAGTAEHFDVFATHGYIDGLQGGGANDPEDYWNGIEPFDRPYWITEGSTGSHTWPTPILSGIAGHLHYALVGGNASAFVAWQITDVANNQHGVMQGGQPTKKTYAAMHYWRFIRPGFVRVDVAMSGSDASGLRVSAFRDPSSRRLVVVAINTNTSARPFDLNTLGNMNANRLEMYQTTSSSDFQNVGFVNLDTANPSVSLPARSITTFASLEPVTGVAFAETEIDLDIGGESRMKAMVSPMGASNQKLNWQSSNPSVATVDGSGIVTGIDEGNATITATSEDGGFAATSTVHVSFSQWAEWPVQKSGYVHTGDTFIGSIFARKDSDWVYSYDLNNWIHLPESSVTSTNAWAYLANSSEASLQTSHTRFDGDEETGGYSAHADEVANVLEGKPITVSAFNSDSPPANLVDGLTADPAEGSTRWVTSFGSTSDVHWARIDMGTLYHLTEFQLYTFENRDYRYTISVSEDDAEYTRVADRRNTSNGGSGNRSSTVDVTARYVLLEVYHGTPYGSSYTGEYVNLSELMGFGTQVTVPVTGVSVKPVRLQRGVGQTYPLQAVVTPTIATNHDLLWLSDNPSVATVSADGLVTAVAEGEAVITVTTEDGGLTAETEVVVGPSPIWGMWPVAESGLAETDGFAGWIYIPDDLGWIYIHSLGRWAWLPETFVETGGAWMQLIR